MIRLLIVALALLGGISSARAGGPVMGIAETLTTPVQLDVPPDLAPPDAATVAARAAHLSAQMRCPVCQGLSVADSNSEAAVNMRARIRELVEQGYSDQQITHYFVTRYGEWIVLEPDAQGLSWLIFLGPGVVVLIGSGVIAKRLAGAPDDTQDQPLEDIEEQPLSEEPEPVAPSSDAYRDRILAELGESAPRGAGEDS